ncbi:hypothetical protein [Streptomyces fractus]|uniref:right-handed parallel beta-helix repeat-containing protein n=1 Tax=Streptomyces fractus TaxID=641806 RepID=UPI003CF22751
MDQAPLQTQGTVRRRALATLGLAGLTAAATGATTGTAHAEPAADASGGVSGVEELRTRPGASNGEQLHLLGYRQESPGIGGGPVYWDADSTQDDNGGTVFAVAGTATGRWKRPHAAHVDLAWFGCDGSGEHDDASRVQAAVDSLPAGGVVEAGPGKFRLEHTIEVTSVPITFVGTGPTDNDDYATQYVVATGDKDGFLLQGVHGGGMRDLVVRGDGLTGGSLVATRAPEGERNYMVSYANCRFKNGYNGMTLRSCNTIRFRNCVWNGFNGSHVILLNGESNTSRADPVEFVQCGIAAGTGNEGVDNVVVDGLGGSLKFLACALLFGRHGLWLKNTTGGSYPKFVYFESGGFENGHGYPVLLDAGAQAQFANVYISSDSELDNVRINKSFTGTATFTGCIIRGCGRNGIDTASTRVTVTGCVIGNNGRTAHPDFARTLAGITRGPDGKVRVTTSDAHGWESDDRVTVSGVTGTTEANGTWRVTVVDATHFDLPVDHAHTYSGGGSAYRHGAGLNIRADASRTTVVGNEIGALADGVNRQDYGIVCDAVDVLAADNDLQGNEKGPYLLTGKADARTRFTGNKGMEQIDGWLVATVNGRVTDGSYDFGNLLYAAGQRIRIVRATHKLASGTCSLRLHTDGDTVDGDPLPVTDTVRHTTLATPMSIDALERPVRVTARVSDAAGATGLEVQFGYQVVG